MLFSISPDHASAAAPLLMLCCVHQFMKQTMTVHRIRQQQEQVCSLGWQQTCTAADAGCPFSLQIQVPMQQILL
jgi:hypothetical protein